MASLGVLVSGMAHEINNPINLIRLNSQTMLEVWLGIMEYLEQHIEEKWVQETGSSARWM